MKCDEGHPHCDNCQKANIECDYSVRLNWLGDGNYRPSKKRRPDDAEASSSTSSTVFSRASPRNEGNIGSLAESRRHDPELLSFFKTTIYTELSMPPSVTPSTTALASLDFTPINKLRPNSHFGPAPLDSVEGAPQPSIPNDAVSNHAVKHRSYPRREDAPNSRHERGPLTTEESGVGSVRGSGTSPYDETGTAGTSPSPQSPRKKHRHGFRPVSLAGVTDISPWSPSSPSTAGSPEVRPYLQSNFSLPSAPSPLTSISTPGGEDDHRCVPRTTPHVPSPSDVRRLSVQSLLSVPHDASMSSERTFSGLGRGSHNVPTRAITPETATFYGYDTGEPDRDIGQNDDARGIMGYSPVDSKEGQEFASAGMTRESHPSDFGFGMRETRNYYERPVEVWISKELEPLPNKLRQNPMNLLYFHHFLNHTARVLVPHDDPQSNPFRTVLPQMAVKHDNLLSLLLAYSASHRARHLKYPEPSLRIAHLVQGVIADLRSLVQQSMNNPETVISTADLAAAIMLASLEIISPAAIGGSIPWHHHLNLARELISRMPDGLRRIQPATQEHCIRSLLWSWFAYLDVLGSLSGGPATLLTPSCYTTGGPPSPGLPQSEEGHWDEDMESIDCILGFTPRCVFILARIAELARHCEEARLRQPGWTPDAATRAAATALETAALRSLAAPSRPCGHVHAPSPLRRWDRTQMAAANRAFHHAALIHLHRRVLGKRSGHPDVRGAAQSILECLEHVERGSSAETCLLFPMFTAGCELVDSVERGAILERILTVERTGMMQVQRARRLMEKVWETGQPWEMLVDAEFIG